MQLSTASFLLLLVILLHSSSYGSADEVEPKWLSQLGDDIEELVTGRGNNGIALSRVRELLTPAKPFKGVSKRPSNLNFPMLDQIDPEKRGILSCSICRTVVDSALGWWEAGDTEEQIVDKLVTLCVDSGITERVCRGTIEINSGIILWIVDARNASGQPLTAKQMCGFAMYPDCGFDFGPWTWELDLTFLGPKPTPVEPQPPAEGMPTMSVLQFTDIHVDPNYTPGFNAECDEPMCCRFDQGPAPNMSAEAGYWGDYRDCDAPVHAFKDQLRFAAAQHQNITYVIFTGDIIDHGVWATSEQYNTDLMTLVRDEFAFNFPGVPVIPIVGNHEAHPVNVFSDPLKTEVPQDLSTTWLYQLWVDLWSVWLPPSTAPDILQGGMFEYEVLPGLVVIGINTMFCYNYNWWILYDNVDPAGELMWLATRLLEAERTGKAVHILAHHPSGRPDCTHFWSSQYRRIIDRFEATVVAQFHGHTHNDHFNIYYDLEDPSRPTTVSFTAGSGTPASNLNPNYRLFLLDGHYPGSTFRVLDHETWYYNLTEANLAGPDVPPNWQRLYSFNEAYNVSSHLPAELDGLVHRMAADQDLQLMYWRYYVKEGDPSLEKGCDDECLQNLVCKITVTVQNDESKCAELFPPPPA